MASDFQSGWISHLRGAGLWLLSNSPWAGRLAVSTAGLASHKLHFAYSRRNMRSCHGAESHKPVFKDPEPSSPWGSKAILGVDAPGRCLWPLGPLSARPIFGIPFVMECVEKGQAWVEGRNYCKLSISYMGPSAVHSALAHWVLMTALCNLYYWRVLETRMVLGAPHRGRRWSQVLLCSRLSASGSGPLPQAWPDLRVPPSGPPRKDISEAVWTGAN